MKPPGKTTFDRMVLTAQAEVERIELGHDVPELVRRRDDFAGIVRLIDVILTDPALQRDIVERLRRWAASPENRPEASE
jgi:hypothetical protein